MNYYLVVEGASDKVIYTNWIPLLNPTLTVVPSISDVTDNCVYIVSAMGYPQYFEIIENAINDVAALGIFSKLVVAIDSEEMSLQEKKDEISNFIRGINPQVVADIIVQHFCIETWALGHTNAFPRTNGTSKFIEYRKFFNVLVNDPELLPDYPAEDLNRAQFAAKYLRHGLNSNSPRITYSKSKPEVICHPKYFRNLIKRLESTQHISSMNSLVAAFQ